MILPTFDLILTFLILPVLRIPGEVESSDGGINVSATWRALSIPLNSRERFDGLFRIGTLRILNAQFYRTKGYARDMKSENDKCKMHAISVLPYNGLTRPHPLLLSK